MPLPAWAIYAGISAAPSVWGYITRKKPRRFEETEYGQRLQEVSEEGAYTPELRRKLIGQVSSAAGGIAQRRKAEIRGRLEAGGIGAGSIAGIRATTEPVLEQMRVVSRAQKDIGVEQERSKVAAKEEIARLSTMSEERRVESERQAKGELAGGLIGAAGAGFGGYINERAFKEAQRRAKEEFGLKERQVGVAEETLAQRGEQFETQQALKERQFGAEYGLKEKELGMTKEWRDAQIRMDEEYNRIREDYNKGMIDVDKMKIDLQRDVFEWEKTLGKAKALDSTAVNEFSEMMADREKIYLGELKAISEELTPTAYGQIKYNVLRDLLNDPRVLRNPELMDIWDDMWLKELRYYYRGNEDGLQYILRKLSVSKNPNKEAMEILKQVRGGAIIPIGIIKF